MRRNLLAEFVRDSAEQVNIPLLEVGKWTSLSSPEHLAKLEYSQKGDQQIRTRIQSIPSPWARLLLFRNALAEPKHPARAEVGSGILDAFELIWSLDTLAGVSLQSVKVTVGEFEKDSIGISSRVEQFASALAQLQPDINGRHSFKTITVVHTGGRPIFASSPYTAVFTAEDAGQSRLGVFFNPSQYRSLVQRPKRFQTYVATVLMPQISGLQSSEDVDAATVQRLLGAWLTEQLKQCDVDYDSALPQEALREFAAGSTGGLRLYTNRAEQIDSRWSLVSSRYHGTPPIVLEKSAFDNRYYDGAAEVQLPKSLKELKRDTLPVQGMRYPWVSPVDHWLPEKLVLFNELIEVNNVIGFGNFQSQAPSTHPLVRPRLALPLTGDFFRYYGPEDVEKRLRIDVASDGSIDVQLRVSVGSGGKQEELFAKRIYKADDIIRDAGPSLALWPSFLSEGWRDYLVLRHDTSQQVRRDIEIGTLAEGLPIPMRVQEWTPLMSVAWLDGAPEVVELKRRRDDPAAPGITLGVLLPRLVNAGMANQAASWDVGIDFGTSNTVMSIRGSGATRGDLQELPDMTLLLTQPTPDMALRYEMYFMPGGLEAKPFGTAVVHVNPLTTLDPADDRVGLNVSVPFRGRVAPGDKTSVTGDLKWSSDQRGGYLSSAFLRHLALLVLAAAVKRNIAPAQVSFCWAYPRAFSKSQQARLRQEWERVMKLLGHLGVQEGAANKYLDESKCVLQHFVDVGQGGVGGLATVIADIGGGTTDIVACGNNNQVLVLDSVILGGRNIAGSRVQSKESRNPLVGQIVEWARSQGFERIGEVDKYRSEGQEHLAFSFVLADPWIRERLALLTSQPVFARLQRMILYFFGALSYYLGMSLKSVGTGLPYKIILAGNGSRYLNWLTDFHSGEPGDEFRRVLAQLVKSGAGIADSGQKILIELSEQPKREVVLGLVANPVAVDEDKVARDPVIGEHITLAIGAQGISRTYESLDRLEGVDGIAPQHTGSIRWNGSRLTIQSYHEALLTASESLRSYGPQWKSVTADYRIIFDGLGVDGIKQQTMNRLQYLATVSGEYRGSIFIVEAALVLDAMMGV